MGPNAAAAATAGRGHGGIFIQGPALAEPARMSAEHQPAGADGEGRAPASAGVDDEFDAILAELFRGERHPVGTSDAHTGWPAPAPALREQPQRRQQHSSPIFSSPSVPEAQFDTQGHSQAAAEANKAREHQTWREQARPAWEGQQAPREPDLLPLNLEGSGEQGVYATQAKAIHAVPHSSSSSGLGKRAVVEISSPQESSTKRPRIALTAEEHESATEAHIAARARLAARHQSDNSSVGSSDLNNFLRGKWEQREQVLLCHVVYCFLSRELKDIARIANSCGIRRSSRSIDKKLKRILGFEKWRDRRITPMRASLARIMHQNGWASLSAEDRAAVERARSFFNNKNMPSFPPLWTGQ